MVLVVPPRDIHGEDVRSLEKVGVNLFDKINAAFENEYASELEEKWGRPEVSLTMPMFRQVQSKRGLNE